MKKIIFICFIYGAIGAESGAVEHNADHKEVVEKLEKEKETPKIAQKPRQFELGNRKHYWETGAAKKNRLRNENSVKKQKAIAEIDELTKRKEA